jgi:hypothetical protein
MGAGRINFPLILVLSFAMVLACTPFAAAQGVEDICNTYTICLATIVLFLVLMLYAYLQKKRQAENAAQRLPSGGQPSMAEPVPRGYEQTPSYGTTPYPSDAPGYTYAPQPQGAPGYTYAPQPQGAPDYSYAPQPQDIPGYPTAPTIPGAPRDYAPMMAVEAPPRRRKASAPGACPRCGSKNIQNFETGEHKCLECKKIYMD